jgi:hypothetical protein
MTLSANNRDIYSNINADPIFSFYRFYAALVIYCHEIGSLASHHSPNLASRFNETFFSKVLHSIVSLTLDIVRGIG